VLLAEVNSVTAVPTPPRGRFRLRGVAFGGLASLKVSRALLRAGVDSSRGMGLHLSLAKLRPTIGGRALLYGRGGPGAQRQGHRREARHGAARYRAASLTPSCHRTRAPLVSAYTFDGSCPGLIPSKARVGPSWQEAARAIDDVRRRVQQACDFLPRLGACSCLCGSSMPPFLHGPHDRSDIGSGQSIPSGGCRFPTRPCQRLCARRSRSLVHYGNWHR
jgi:hypothetical protein